jgi:hypothetical protein
MTPESTLPELQEAEKVVRQRTHFTPVEKSKHYLAEAVSAINRLGSILVDLKLADKVSKLAAKLAIDLTFINELPVEQFKESVPRGRAATTLAVGDVVVLREAFDEFYGKSLKTMKFKIREIVNENRVIAISDDGMGYGMAVKHIKPFVQV